MTTTRSSARRRFPAGRRVAAALLVSTLAATALAACGTGAQGAQPTKASGGSADRTTGAAEIAWGRCPALAEGQTRDPRLTVGFLATGHLPAKDVHCTDVTRR